MFEHFLEIFRNITALTILYFVSTQKLPKNVLKIHILSYKIGVLFIPLCLSEYDWQKRVLFKRQICLCQFWFCLVFV